MLEKLETPKPKFLREGSWPEYGTRDHDRLSRLTAASWGFSPPLSLPKPRIKNGEGRWLSNDHRKWGPQSATGGRSVSGWLHNRVEFSELALYSGAKYHWVNIGMAIKGAWQDALKWFVRSIKGR